MASRRLEVVIAGDASGATRALGQLEDRTQRTSRSMGTMRRVGAGLAGVFAGVQIGQFLRGAIGEAEEAATALRQTEAVIRSTGGVAGVTSGHLVDLAGSLSEIAAVDDEVIQQGGNVLLTFRNIKAEGGIFDDALTAALDMSSAMGTQLQPAIMAIGRALNDPAEGLSRLSRMGVTFTEQQKAQIEAMAAFGNTAGAQRVILEELATEFGGAAEANATATGRMTVAWENLKEQIGTALLPAMSGLADVTERLTAGFSSLSEPMQKIVTAVTLIGAAALAAGAVFSSVWAGVAVVAAAALGAQIFLVWRITQPLRDLFFAVVHQLQRWWQQAQPIRDVMRQIGAQAMGALRVAVGWLVTAFRAWWEASAPVRSVLNLIGAIGMFALRSAVSNVITLLRTAWNASAPVRTVLAAIGAMSWTVIRSAITTVANGLRVAWQASAPLRDALASIGSMALSALVSAVNSIRSGFQSVSSLLDSIASKINSLPSPSGLLSALPGVESAGLGGGASIGGSVAIATAGGGRRASRGPGVSMASGDTHVTVMLPDGQVLGRTTVRANRRDHRAYAGAGGGDY